MKIRPVGAELFHADGLTDRHEEANSRISQLCEGAKNLLMEKYNVMRDKMDTSLKTKNLFEAFSCRLRANI